MEEEILNNLQIDYDKKTITLVRNIERATLYLNDLRNYLTDSNLKDFTFIIGNNISDISNIVFDDYSCECKIMIDTKNNYFTMYENNIYSKDMTELYFFNLVLSHETINLPPHLKIIKSNAFYCDSELIINKSIVVKKIIFNTSLYKIEPFAFEEEFPNTNIYINNGLSDIYPDSFACSGINFIIDNNKNFLSAKDYIVHTPTQKLFSINYNNIIKNLPQLLQYDCSYFFDVIIAQCRLAMSANDKNINNFIFANKGILADKTTIFAYLGNEKTLVIPNNIKYFYEKFYSKTYGIDLFIPESLIQINKKSFKNNNTISTKKSNALQSFTNIIVDKNNPIFYSNKFCLYNKTNNEIELLIIPKNKIIEINDENIQIIKGPFISQFSHFKHLDNAGEDFVNLLFNNPREINKLIFSGTYPLKIFGKIASHETTIKQIIITNNKLELDYNAFDRISGLSEILISDLALAKRIYFNLKNKRVKNTIYFYNNNQKILIKNYL